MAIDFRTVQGSPCGKLIAPYISICATDAKATVNSIYRGADAEPILNAHGKHSQAQLYAMYQAGKGAPANRPGTSTHELRSDGVAYSGPSGRELDWWQVGIDVNDSDVPRMISTAHEHGWELFQPYKSGVEFHHVNFRTQPSPHSVKDRLRVLRLRATLPRK